MRHASILIFALFAASMLGGCAGKDKTPSPTPTPTPPTPPPTTSSPSPSSPTTTAPPPPAVDAVYVTTAPIRVSAFTQFDVCWRVEGTGTIPHTAVHWDTESHFENAAYSDYDGGPPAYPGGGTSQNPAGYKVPAVFCSRLSAPADGRLYFRAHAHAGNVIGRLSPEQVVEVGTSGDIHFTGTPPQVAPANSKVMVCWRIPWAGATSHTGVHWDTATRADSPNDTDYKGGEIYVGNATSDPGAQSIPAGGKTFCSNLRMPAAGVIYYRAHVFVGGGGVNLSVERNVAVGDSVTLSGTVPASATAGSKVTLCWRVEGTGRIAHTGIVWDTSSHPNANSFSEYLGGVIYPNNETAPTAAGYDVPARFCTEITMSSSTFYFRAYGIRGADSGELSREHMIGRT